MTCMFVVDMQAMGIFFVLAPKIFQKAANKGKTNIEWTGKPHSPGKP